LTLSRISLTRTAGLSRQEKICDALDSTMRAVHSTHWHSFSPRAREYQTFCTRWRFELGYCRARHFGDLQASGSLNKDLDSTGPCSLRTAIVSSQERIVYRCLAKYYRTRWSTLVVPADSKANKAKCWYMYRSVLAVLCPPHLNTTTVPLLALY